MPVWLGVIKEMEALTRLFSTTFIVVVSLLISILCCVGLHASPENIKPNVILQSTGLNGGLCLIIGDDSLTLGKDLAKNSGLYVQILQADSKKAFRWGLDLAKSPQRESWAFAFPLLIPTSTALNSSICLS